MTKNQKQLLDLFIEKIEEGWSACYALGLAGLHIKTKDAIEVKASPEYREVILKYNASVSSKKRFKSFKLD